MKNELEVKNVLQSRAEDMYKISKVLHQYCEQHRLCEEINDVLPLTREIYTLSDNLLCDLNNFLSNDNPDRNIA